MFHTSGNNSKSGIIFLIVTVLKTKQNQLFTWMNINTVTATRVFIYVWKDNYSTVRLVLKYSILIASKDFKARNSVT